MSRRISTKTVRRAAALLLVVLAAPIIWLRTEVTLGDADDLRLDEVAFTESEDGEFRVTGLWELTSPDLIFGGYSALLVSPDGMMVTFSDRGRFLTFSGPEGPDLPPAIGMQLPDAGMEQRLWDIESATQDPESGTFWLGYEGEHGIQRYTARGAPDGHVLFPDVEWSLNGGLESLVRLDDGRFVGLPEDEEQLYLFAQDPVTDPKAVTIAIDWPEPDYKPTDAAQLPDGRLLVLMRRVVWRLPPTFDSILVVGDLPEEGDPWQPELALTLHDQVARDNYEGMDLVSHEDGSADLWLISDDNFSAFQRTLLVRIAVATPPTEESPTQERRAD